MGFYDAALHARRPADAVPITEKRHAELLRGQSQRRAVEAEAKRWPAARSAAFPLADHAVWPRPCAAEGKA